MSGFALGLVTANSVSAGAFATESFFLSSFLSLSLSSLPRVRAEVKFTSSFAAQAVALPIVTSVPPFSIHVLRFAPLPSTERLASGTMMTLNASRLPLSAFTVIGVNGNA